jgi:antitoxin component of RelBE/YafQ-DinJ toxin-antitoxin module
MSEKHMVSAKIAPRTKERLDNYKEEQGVSRSQAIDIMLKQGLDVEESDMRLVPVKTDGGTKIKNEIEETQKQVNSIEDIAQKLDEQQTELKDDVQQNNLNYALLGAGLAYIIIQISVGLPSDLGLAVGVPLIIALVWANFVR